MKKTYLTILAVAAIVCCFSSCKKDDNGKKKDNKEEEFVSPITIDGNFTDWAAVKAASVTLPTSGTIAKPQIKTFKVYADKMYINFYMEFDKTNIYVVDMLIDTDNSVATGQVDNWTGGAEVLLQNKVYAWSSDKTTQLEAVNWDPSVFVYSGEAGSSAWEWTDAVSDGSGVCNTSLPVELGDNIVAIEGQIVREMIPITFADTFGLGAIIETRKWSSVGIAPAISEEDKADGKKVDMLRVTIDKK